MSHIVQIFPGLEGLENFVSQKDLGSGFKLNVQDGEQPRKALIFEGDTSKEPWATSEVTKKLLDSAEKCHEMLGVKASLSVAYKIFSGSGSGEYMKNLVKSSNRVVLFYKAFYTRHAQVLSKPKLISHFSDLATNDQDAFMEKFGQCYISKIFYGACCTVKCEITADDSVDLMKLAASLKLSIGIGPLSVDAEASVDYKSEATSHKHNVAYEAKGVGTDVVDANPSSLEDVNTYLKKFNERYTALADEALTPVAFQVEAMSVAMPNPLTQAQEAVFRNRMEKCGEAFRNVLYLDGLLRWQKEYVQQTHKGDPKLHNEVSIPLCKKILSLQKQIDSFMTKVLQYRSQGVQQIINNDMMDTGEVDIGGELCREIDAVSGFGHVKAEELVKLKVLPSTGYKGVYYQGSVLNGKPWFKGELLNPKNKVLKQGLLHDLFPDVVCQDWEAMADEMSQEVDMAKEFYDGDMKMQQTIKDWANGLAEHFDGKATEAESWQKAEGTEEILEGRNHLWRASAVDMAERCKVIATHPEFPLAPVIEEHLKHAKYWAQQYDTWCSNDAHANELARDIFQESVGKLTDWREKSNAQQYKRNHLWLLCAEDWQQRFKKIKTMDDDGSLTQDQLKEDLQHSQHWKGQYEEWKLDDAFAHEMGLSVHERSYKFLQNAVDSK